MNFPGMVYKQQEKGEGAGRGGEGRKEVGRNISKEKPTLTTWDYTLHLHLALGTSPGILSTLQRRTYISVLLTPQIFWHIYPSSP